MSKVVQLNSEYATMIDNYALCISRPSLRYHFLQAALSEYQHPFVIFNCIPGVRSFLYHLYIAKALYKTDKSNKYLTQQNLPLLLKSLWLYYKTRFILLLILLVVLGRWLYVRHQESSLREAISKESMLIKQPMGKLAQVEDPLKLASVVPHKQDEIIWQLEEKEKRDYSLISRQGLSQDIMNLSFAHTLNPDTIWQVESKKEYELYSNGLRILRDYETITGKRCFLIFRKGSAGLPNPNKIYHDPVGIVYHTTESDIQPFAEENNQNILKATRNLLKYVKKITCYNYLIDRFGRVYRIVKDENYAYHAGESIWASGDTIYVNLNHSFIGVSFEGRSTLAGTMNEPSITPMQLVSAGRLTDMLRQRYKIEDRNCVVHGIISVNSKNKIIGYHLDWAQDFPFELLGLSDKYQIPCPSILEFGFGYSSNMIHSLGGQAWPGVYLAENVLKERAKKEKIRLGELSFTLQTKFDEMVDYQNSVRDKQKARR